MNSDNRIKRIVAALRELANQLEKLQRINPAAAELLADHLKNVASNQDTS